MYIYVNKADGSGIELREMSVTGLIEFAQMQMIKQAQNMLYMGKSDAEIEYELGIPAIDREDFWAQVGPPCLREEIRRLGEQARN